MDNKNENLREELLAIMPEQIALETSIGAFQYKINELMGRYLELGFTAEDIINIAESVKDDYLNRVTLNPEKYPWLQETKEDVIIDEEFKKVWEEANVDELKHSWKREDEAVGNFLGDYNNIEFIT